MAPEQARGETEAIDCRADVFALGAILCEILTGAPAFSGGSAIQIVKAARRADTAGAVARLEQCDADLELLDLARHCLAASSRDRPADAGVVAGRMTAYLAGVQDRLHEAELSRAAESARAQEAEAKVSAERRARRLTAALAAAVLVAGSLGAGGWRWVVLQRLERLRETSGRVDVALREATRLCGGRTSGIPTMCGSTTTSPARSRSSGAGSGDPLLHGGPVAAPGVSLRAGPCIDGKWRVGRGDRPLRGLGP
jgi:serine/threonine-protein kinase